MKRAQIDVKILLTQQVYFFAFDLTAAHADSGWFSQFLKEINQCTGSKKLINNLVFFSHLEI